jgi:superfamily II DNA or RNA helicase
MKGDIRIIFATQAFKLGLDIAVLDTLYATCPMNNQPLLEQMLGRVRRPHPGKMTPVFRYFVDGGHGLLVGCAKGTQKHLKDIGADIHLVKEGFDPLAQMEVATFNTQISAKADAPKTKTKGLAAMVRKEPSALDALLGDD